MSTTSSSTSSAGSAHVALFCRNCGKALSDFEKSEASIYCVECAPQFASSSAAGYGSPQSAAAPGATASGMRPVADPNVSPGLAFLLGLIPGVGAIYNGQYAKGLVHVFIFGTLMSIANSARDLEALFALMVAGFYFYMPFEAFHTAQRRQRGLPVDEFSSIIPMKGRAGGYPVGPVVLIGLGVLFLLNNFGLLPIGQVFRLWPLALIGIGVMLLRERMSGGGGGGEVR